MKKFFLFLMTAMPCLAFAQFAAFFEDASLRLDYYVVGTDKTTEYCFKELIREPYWGGSKTNLIDSLGYGDYYVEMYDASNGKMLFSRGYCNLFGEWQTTDEAKRVTKGFEETVVMPFPKKEVDVVLGYKTWEGERREGFRMRVRPDDYFIRTAPANTLPIYDAWIGNKDYSKAVDIVVLPEGYTQEEMGKFINDCNFFVKSLFAYHPYDKYKDRFNVRAVMAPSADSDVTMPGEHIYRNTAMNFSFWTFDSERYCMSTDSKSIRDLAGKVPYDQIYILINTQKYGGGGIYNFYCSSATGNSFSSDIIIHEFGHAFAGLADEYYDDDTYEHMYNLDIEPWEPNITTKGEKWADMIGKKTPVPTPATDKYKDVVGLFEGGGYEPKGMYRPMYDCLMKTFYGDVFCPVCVRAIEKMILYYSE